MVFKMVFKMVVFCPLVVGSRTSTQKIQFSEKRSSIVARAKRGRVVQDEVEEVNRRHGTIDTAPKFAVFNFSRLVSFYDFKIDHFCFRNESRFRSPFAILKSTISAS